MTEEVEKAIEDLARALDKVCDMIDDGDFTRMMMGISLREMADAEVVKNKLYYLGYIAGMVQDAGRKVGDAADEKVSIALETLYHVMSLAMKEEKHEKAESDV